MREILFRGKRIDNGEWVIGAGVYKSEGYTWIITDDVTKTENRGTGSDAIIPETIGQYTGLTDKNGTKIFEGDIVFAKYGELKKIGFVFYYERGAKFGIRENSGYDNLSLLFDKTIHEWDIKVIGNIHDNPELIGGDQNAR